MARRTNKDRLELALARAGVVDVNVVKEVKEAIKKPTRKVTKKVVAEEPVAEEPVAEEPTIDVGATEEELEELTVAELRDIASDIDVGGRSKMNKDELIDGIVADDDWKR